MKPILFLLFLCCPLKPENDSNHSLSQDNHPSHEETNLKSSDIVIEKQEEATKKKPADKVEIVSSSSQEEPENSESENYENSEVNSLGFAEEETSNITSNPFESFE